MLLGVVEGIPSETYFFFGVSLEVPSGIHPVVI